MFGDIYDFAGEIRDEAIYKSNEPYFHSNTPFCYPSFIYKYLNDYLRDMSMKYDYIKGRDDLLTFIARYYGEINMIHPFREGNGRTLRTFMVLFVEYLNNRKPDLNFEIQYSLWSKNDREKLLEATINCNETGNYDMIRECFDKVLVSRDVKKKSR